MTIKINDKIPDLSLLENGKTGPNTLSTAELFSNKKVVLFAVPGAFTGTCSSKHVPSYLDNYDAIKSRGVDEIVVVSVNDLAVMGAWAKDTKAEGKIRFLADWDAAFTESLGLEVDLSFAKLGLRSSRYSMIVENGVITSLNREEKAGSIEKSGALQILKDLQV